MAEITQHGYAYIRDRIYEDWRYLQLTNDEGERITRISTNDYRLNMNYTEGSPVLKLELEIQGSNHDISIPSTIASLEIYEDSETDIILAEAELEPNIKIESVNDIISIDQYIEVPRITF